MIEIVICDDDPLFLDRITPRVHSILTERSIAFRLAPFTSSQRLLNELIDRGGIAQLYILQQINKI